MFERQFSCKDFGFQEFKFWLRAKHKVQGKPTICSTRNSCAGFFLASLG